MDPNINRHAEPPARRASKHALHRRPQINSTPRLPTHPLTRSPLSSRAMTDTHAILGEALEHHQAGPPRPRRRRSIGERALEVDPERADRALPLWPVSASETGQIEAALRLLTKVVELRPDHAQARVTLANIQHWRGDYASAAAKATSAVIGADSPAHLAAHIGLAKALRDEGELDAAAGGVLARRLGHRPGPGRARYETLGERAGRRPGDPQKTEAGDRRLSRLAMRPGAGPEPPPRSAWPWSWPGEDSAPASALEAADAALALDAGPGRRLVRSYAEARR